MRIGFASSNPSFSRPVLEELSTRGHQIIHYQHSADLQQNAYQIGKLKAMTDAIFIDFAQEPLLAIVHDIEVPVTVRMHRVEMYMEENYVVNTGEGPRPFPWDRVENLVFVAEHVKQRFVENCNGRGVPLPRNMPVVPHVGVDCDLFRRADRDWSKPPFVMVCAGNLIPKKRQYTLIEMFADAEARWPGMFGLRIIGSSNMGGYGNSEYHANCTDALVRLGLGDKVMTSPSVPHDQMPMQFADSAFVVSASNEEGCATTVAEGMATGCIPLVANWRGAGGLYPEEWLWDTPTGFLNLLHGFMERKPEEAAAESLRMREWVKGRYSMPDVAGKVADLAQSQTKAAFYDGMIEHWVQQRDNPRQVAQGEWMVKNINPFTRMLEVGCAIGRQCELAKRPRPDGQPGAARVVGVDISRAAIFHAITSAQQNEIELEYGLVTEDEDLPPGPFDLVLLFDVLEHVNPSRAYALLQRISRVIEPGGRLLIAFPYEAQVHDGGFQVEEYICYPKQVRQALESLGFEVAMSPFGEDAEEFRMEAVKHAATILPCAEPQVAPAPEVTVVDGDADQQEPDPPSDPPVRKRRKAKRKPKAPVGDGEAGGKKPTRPKRKRAPARKKRRARRARKPKDTGDRAK